jgi:hypothetical protein
MGLIGLAFLIVLLRYKPLYLSELALGGLSLYLAFSHRRMLFVFGIVIAPIAARLFADSCRQYGSKRNRVAVNAVVLLVSACMIVVAFPSPGKLEQQSRAAVPDGAVKYIRNSGLSGNMLNLYDWGGYLIWALPEHKVFVDGRGDIFEWTGVLKEYQDWAVLDADPAVLLEKYDIAFCLLSINSPLSRVMPLLPGWKGVYSDNTAIVFARAATNGGDLKRDRISR